MGLKVSVIRGDGIGPEVVGEALKLLQLLDLEVVEVKAGKAYFKETGKPIQEDGLDLIRETEALLKGPIATPTKGRTYPSVNLLIRKEFNLYANIRPFRSFPGYSIRRMDLVIVRENLEGLYWGEEYIQDGKAVTLRVITEKGVERITRKAFELALNEGRKRVTAIHKKNVLKKGDGLFLDVFYRVAQEYPVEADDYIVDAAAYRLVKVDDPFDVMVTPNLYGDILSDVAAGVIGSLGLCGSAMIGDDFAAFEPIHGTAEDIAGKGVANPIGTFLATAMMLEWLSSRGYEKAGALSRLIKEGVEYLLRERLVTPDLGGKLKTYQVTEHLLDYIRGSYEAGGGSTNPGKNDSFGG